MINSSSSNQALFLTVIPGLETAAYLELCEKMRQASAFFSEDQSEIRITKGGVEFKAPLQEALQLNRFLKVPTRMLLRVLEFEALNENIFRQEIKKIDWKKYFQKGMTFDLGWSSRSSRLSMKKQVIALFEEELKPLGVKFEKGGSLIYVRLFRDKCNISLDTTGERSQFRGGGKKVSVASLRDSTAAGLLRILLQGLDEDHVLIDPMCGSGTFLTEALSLREPMNRKFEYQKFPMVKEAGSREVSMEASELNHLKKVYGFDNHEKAVELAKNNLSQYKSDKWIVENKDLFKDNYTFESNYKKVVILNPPWGKRLPASSKDFVSYVDKKIKPDRLGILIPSHWMFNAASMEKVRDIPILNSGVENRFILFARP